MSLRKKGLSLIELLIAIATIGIISAIVVPALVASLQTFQTGPRVGKVVKQTELGARNIIERCNERLSPTGTSGNMLSVFTQNELIDNGINNEYLSNSWNIIAPFLNYEPITLNKDEIIINNYDGTTSNEQNTVRRNALRYRLSKQTSIIYVVQKNNIPHNTTSTIANLYIDTNGLDAPNAFGKDIFLFDLTNGGRMIPYGLTAGDHYTDNCTNNNITDGKACTARLIKDNYKITY